MNQPADTQRDVEPLADHIDERVAEVDVTETSGSFQEVRQDRRDPAEYRGHRCGEPHHSAGSGRLRKQCVLGGFGVRQKPGRVVGDERARRRSKAKRADVRVSSRDPSRCSNGQSLGDGGGRRPSSAAARRRHGFDDSAKIAVSPRCRATEHREVPKPWLPPLLLFPSICRPCIRSKTNPLRLRWSGLTRRAKMAKASGCWYHQRTATSRPWRTPWARRSGGRGASRREAGAGASAA